MSEREASSDVKDREQSPKPRGASSPPVQASSTKQRNQLPRQAVQRSQSSNFQFTGRRPPLLRQESSLSRRYDHIQPKVDLKLEERFTPAASQVRVPLYNKRRSTFSADNQWKHLEQSANDNLEADQYGTEEEEYTAENLHDIGERPASSAQASPSYSDQIKDYFGRTPSTPETIASPYYSESGSPSYRSKSETQSLTNSPFDSRSSSRTGSFEHPTSNPAGYAIATDSFRRKINERRDYDIVGISRAPPFQRKKTFERGESSLPMETLERLGREKNCEVRGTGDTRTDLQEDSPS